MDELIDGRYQLLKELDRDPDSAMYVASDIKTGQVAALRLWPAGTSTTRQLLASLPHAQPNLTPAHDPRVVGPYDWGVDGEVVYLAREYVTGRNLAQIVEHEGPLSLKATFGYARQIAGAVAAAHARGLIHGRLRASRVIITDDGQARLVGFEEARMRPDEPPTIGHSHSAVTARSAVAPATRELDHQLGEQRDIFAIGAMAYYMLTMDDPMARLAFAREREGAFRPLSAAAKRPVIPDWVDSAILFATSRGANGLLPSADEVATRFMSIEQQLRSGRRGPARTKRSHVATPVAAAGGWGQMSRQVKELQGHLAMALLIALAAGLFVITVERGKNAAAHPTAIPLASTRATTTAVPSTPKPPTALPTALPLAPLLAVSPTNAPVPTVTTAPAPTHTAVPPPTVSARAVSAPPTRVPVRVVATPRPSIVPARPTVERVLARPTAALPRRITTPIVRPTPPPTVKATPRVLRTVRPTAVPTAVPTVAKKAPTPAPATATAVPARPTVVRSVATLSLGTPTPSGPPPLVIPPPAPTR